jgi:hypothetical protein
MSGTERESDPEAAAELERLRAALYAPDAPEEAAERYRAAVARATPAPAQGGIEAPADAEAEPNWADEAPAAPPVQPRTRHRLRTALVAGGLLLAAAIGTVLLVPHPPAEVPDQPLRVGPALWSGHGVQAASSPDLEGGGGPLLVRLRCRGDGRVLLAVDSRVRGLTCVAGKTIEDDQYFDGPHDGFLLSLSLVGHPTWTASVHRVLPAAGG